MNLAIFDLDNTLLAGDSDYLWGIFLSEQGLVDKDIYKAKNLQFYEQYKNGSLDIEEFHAFSLKPLSENTMNLLQNLHEEFMVNKIRPLITLAAKAIVQKHREQGDTLLIITATNRFITEPIATELGIENLLASDPEIINGQFTGKLTGIPCFQQGKVIRLNKWLEEYNYNLTNSWFYSDSINDLPLLEKVTNPVAVDPDDKLQQIAIDRQWPVISLR